ncbi:RNA polymerase sigma factor [Microbacterium sp.]|uniref:RNA polymerase sigma factor n=1 Tax=Microbacterium sp. TaxID=51671 RepID=UPI0028125F28|nr:sigma-70 family RNA polymerase sigma factor [Microbacterium sp.]
MPVTSRSVRTRLTRALQDSSPDLLRYFMRRLEREDAADALAEVMATAWARVDSLPLELNEARMWLFGIARNTVLHAIRGNVRRAKLASRLQNVLSQSPAPPADLGVEIRDAINRLDFELAELIRLVHWDGFSLAEAAKILNLPASTARGRYQRARAALREMLAPVKG